MKLSAREREVIGAPPEGTTHFCVHRYEGTGHKLLRTDVEGDGVKASCVPIEFLSQANIRKAFGLGLLRCSWLAVDPKGKTRVLGTGNRFELAQEPAKPEPAPAPAAERPKKKLKVKPGSMRAQMRMLSSLEEMVDRRTRLQILERTQFLQAEAQRNREHMAAIMALITKAEAKAAAPAVDDEAVKKIVSRYLGGINAKLEALASDPAAEVSDLRAMGEMVLPGVSRLMKVGARLMERKFLGGPDAADDADDDEQAPGDADGDQ